MIRFEYLNLSSKLYLGLLFFSYAEQAIDVYVVGVWVLRHVHFLGSSTLSEEAILSIS